MSSSTNRPIAALVSRDPPPIWTAEDEAALQAALARKKAVHEALEAKVRDIAEDIYCYNMGADGLTKELIANARRLIGALAPFAAIRETNK